MRFIIYGVLLASFCGSNLNAQVCYEAPVIINAQAVGADKIRLEWEITDPDSNCNSSIKHFDIVYYRSATERGSVRANADERLREFQVGTPCTTQTCFIEANYEDGELTQSDEVNVTLKEVPPIENLICNPVSFHTLALTWSPVPETCNILNYNVRHKLRERDQCQVVEDEYETDISHEASFNITNLEPHSTYDIEVEPIGDVGNVVSQISAQTGETVSSKPPEDLSFDNKTRRQLMFTWNQPPCGDRNGVIIGYECTLYKIATNVTYTKQEFVTDTYVRFYGLEDYTKYSFEISTSTIGGTGVSTRTTARTEEGVPTAPSGVKSEVHLNSITLRWDTPQNVPGSIQAYYIYHKSSNAEYETYIRIVDDDTDDGLTKFKLDGLLGRTKYTLKISAETGGGMGNWSPEINTTTRMTVAGVAVLGIFLISLGIVVVAILVMIVLRKRLAPRPIMIDIDGQFNPYGIPGDIPWCNFSLGTVLGEGRFGKTYSAMLNVADADEKRLVTCKQLTLKPTASKDELCQKFSRLHTITRHAHVLHVVGFCLKRGNIYVLKEHANQGDLHTYLHRDRPYGIPQDFKLRVSIAITHGMQHLASHMVVHGDLCLHKILLNEISQEWVPKITGYGMTDCYGEFQKSELSSSGTGEAGGSWPVHQCPPEKMERNVVDTKGDIWAFGVLLWEFFTESAAPGRLRTGRIEKCPTTLDKRLYNVMKHCWLMEPRKRPQFFDLAEALTAFLSPDDIDDEEHPYDILKPKERRSRSLRGSSVSQPRVSITSAEVPRRSLPGRRGTTAGAYYSQVPTDAVDDMDEIVLMDQGNEHGDQQDTLGVPNPIMNINVTYSSRMGSIIPGQSSIAPVHSTIEEEDDETPVDDVIGDEINI